MKKLLYLFLVFGLFACSDESADDDNNNNNNSSDSSLLVSKVILEYPTFNDYEEMTYSYNGNKIDEKVVTIHEWMDWNSTFSTSSYKYEYYYTGNQISLIRELELTNDEEYLESLDELEYDSQGRVILRRDYGCINFGNCPFLDLSTFTYNSDGTFTMLTEYFYEGVFVEILSHQTLSLDNNGNVVSSDRLNYQVDSQDCNYLSSHILEYDNNNGPFVNVTGASDVFILNELGRPLYNNMSSFNNPINWSIENQCGQSVLLYNYSYDYNNEGYPETIFRNQNSEVEAIITYEYIENN